MAAGVWLRDEQHTVPSLLERRLESDPDGEYLDVTGTKLSATDVERGANRPANALTELGMRQGDRVATLIENSPDALIAWWGAIRGGFVSVPINTAYKGEYLRHQLADSGSRVLFVEPDLVERAVTVAPQVEDLEHVVVTGDADAVPSIPGVTVHSVGQLLGADDKAPSVDIHPSDLGTFVYTGGTTGLSKGCMLSHNYHAVLAQQIGICWERTPDDVVWTPLPMYHFNALVTAICGTLLFGGRGAIFRRFSVSEFWPEMNRVGATVTSTLGTMAYLLAHDIDRPEMPRSGGAEANTTLRLMGAAPLPVSLDNLIRERFGIKTFSGAYGVTEASLISWQPPGFRNRPDAAGVINDEYFDTRIFDDDDNEVPRNTDGEIVVRPKRPHVMFEGYWGRPEATVATSRNWWYHTGDVGRIDDDGFLYFVDRKADYLRRRGENISSFEVERILMTHGSLADVAVHAVPSQLTEDDLKVTATVKEGASLTEQELFRWCVDQLPYFALPRYIEFRAELPRSPVGRVLKRELRAEGVTPSTWDAEAAGVTYEKRGATRWRAKLDSDRSAKGRRRSGTMIEFHIMLPQMRMTMDAIVERARAAEDAGFTGIAFMDHLAPPLAEDKPMFDAMATAAWVLADTERLTVGHLVLCDSFRQPAVLAREAATLDHASGGRFELGVGAGSVPEEFEIYGISPVDRRVSRLAETLEVLKLLWSGERVDYDGEFRHLRGAQQVPAPTRRIPIVIGGTGPRMMDLVSRYADWWNLPSDNADRLEELAPQAKPARVSVQHVVAYVPAGADRDGIGALTKRRFGWVKDTALAFGNGPELVDHFSRWQGRGVERFYTWFTDFASLETIAGFGREVIGAFS